jgi:hypothetical protein
MIFEWPLGPSAVFKLSTSPPREIQTEHTSVAVSTFKIKGNRCTVLIVLKMNILLILLHYIFQYQSHDLRFSSSLFVANPLALVEVEK